MADLEKDIIDAISLCCSDTNRLQSQHAITITSYDHVGGAGFAAGERVFEAYGVGESWSGTRPAFRTVGEAVAHLLEKRLDVLVAEAQRHLADDKRSIEYWRNEHERLIEMARNRR